MTTLDSVLKQTLERFSKGKEKYTVILPYNNNQLSILPGQHKHDYFEFCVVSEGDVNILHYNRIIKLNHGMTLLIAPGAYHCEMPIGPEHHYRLLWGILDSVIMRLHVSEYHGEEGYRIVEVVDLPNSIRSLISELKSIMKNGDAYIQPYFDQAIIMTAIIYAIDNLKNQPEKKQWKEQIIFEIENYIEDNLSKRITLEDISANIGISPCYLSTLYKKFRGDTLFHYLNEKRIKSACSLLSDPKLHISEISYKVGFDDPCYFSKVFKKISGCTPRKYRNSITA